MKRREFIIRSGHMLLSLPIYNSCFHRRSIKRKPNVILILIDDMGYGDLSCYGNRDVKTTNIDRIADEGIRFSQFYANAPICSPTRVAITTGQYPGRHKINSFLASRKMNRARGMVDFLDPDVPTLAKSLQKNGYVTAHFGKWHMGGGRDVDDAPEPKAYGFSESYVDTFEGMGPGMHHKDMPRSHSTDVYVDKTIDFIKRNRDKPFYVNLCPNDVHDPHLPKPELKQKYRAFSSNPPTQDFYAVLDNLDRQIGRLMAAIKELGLDEQTIIIFTSDNGPTDWPSYYESNLLPPGSTGPLFGRKWCLYEGGIRVPFIVRWKNHIPENRSDEQSIIATIDIFPSLCKITGTPLPDSVDFDGIDASKAFLGKPIEREKEIYWEYRRLDILPLYDKPGNAAFVSPNLAIRKGDWKLLINSDGSEAQLFNLIEDPGERHNLVDQKPMLVKKLSEKVFDWYQTIP